MSTTGDMRDKMKNFWQKFSPSNESMMLSTDHVFLHERDQDEIISYLPNYKGMRVLELAAGIGRFTGKLASLATHVTAVDFIQEYIDKNKKDNGGHTNITFKCADATSLDYPPESFDMVFCNWLFMYMNDDEVSEFFEKVLRWLSPGGYFFLRESCYHKAGNLKFDTSIVIYRTTIDYYEALQSAKHTKKGTAFNFIKGKSLLTYIKTYGNPNQICFLAQKVEGQEAYELVQHMQVRYNIVAIESGERLFGQLWYSTGGEDANRELCTHLSLRPRQKVLDVGCGIGGNALFMARNYKVDVHAVDISACMIHLAIERQAKMEPEVQKRVQFEISDILTVGNEQEIYDVIYSRDVILLIPDKEKLFETLYKWLKPGGTIFFSDFCRGPTPDEKDFVEFCNLKRYKLKTEQEYQGLLQTAGFRDIQSEGRKEKFINIHKMDLKSFVSCKEAFVEDYSEKLYEEYRSQWTDRLRWVQAGLLTWATFIAKK